MTYGGVVPSIGAGYSGFVNGDTSSALTVKPICSTTATSSSPASVSPYPATCGSAVDPNYTMSYVAGSVAVNPTPLADHGFEFSDGLRKLRANGHADVFGLQERRQRLVADPPAHLLADRHDFEPGGELRLDLHGAADANYVDQLLSVAISR